MGGDTRRECVSARTKKGAHARAGSRVEVGKHTGLSSCDRLRGHGPGGMRAFGSMGMCHGKTNVRIGLDRCVSSAAM